jgi:transcriptional regulator GlxA family with amidase domain
VEGRNDELGYVQIPRNRMRFAFVVYDGMTTLDFAGVYDSVTRLRTMGFMPDLEYDVCADKGEVTTFEGLRLIPDKVGNNLSSYDYVFIPGGNGILGLSRDRDFLAWLMTMSKDTVKVSVCGGAILLGLIGALKGKAATTHPALQDALRRFTDKLSNDRVVDEGDVITARGVTSSIDLGLYLCEKMAGADVRRRIQAQMDYTGLQFPGHGE